LKFPQPVSLEQPASLFPPLNDDRQDALTLVGSVFRGDRQNRSRKSGHTKIDPFLGLHRHTIVAQQSANIRNQCYCILRNPPSYPGTRKRASSATYVSAAPRKTPYPLWWILLGSTNWLRYPR